MRPSRFAALALSEMDVLGETKMLRRFRILFATTILTIFAIAACRTPAAPQLDDKQAAINVVLAHEQACQSYDFDKLDSLHTPDSRGIEESYPEPFEPGARRSYQAFKDAGMRIDYRPQDAVAEVRGDVAWVTVTLHSVWTADTPAAQAMLGASEGYATYIESFILLKSPAGWKSP